MAIQKNWWDLTLCGSKLLRESADDLELGSSVALVGETMLPWASYFYDSLKSATVSSAKTFDIVNDESVTNPGVFLLEKYCTHEVQSRFWPEPSSYTRAEYLGEIDDSLLNHRFIIVRNFASDKRFKAWCDFITRYLKRIEQLGKNKSERGIFLLDATGIVSAYNSCYIKPLPFSPKEVDVLTYNLLNTYESYSDYMRNRYAAELISELCDKNLELAGYLSLRKDLIESPVRAYSLCSEDYGNTFPRITDEQVLSRAIMAQYKVLLPLVEKRRHMLIKKYYDGISRCLPWTNDYNEYKSAPFDMELRDIVFKASEIGMSPEDKLISVTMRDIRNQLAHNHLLTSAEINALDNCTVKTWEK